MKKREEEKENVKYDGKIKKISKHSHGRPQEIGNLKVITPLTC